MSITILFLAASPSRNVPLTIRSEMHRNDQQIRDALHGDAIDIIHKLAIYPSELQPALLKHTPHIVHFTGHGTTDEELLFEGEGGIAKPVSKKALGHLFAVLKDNLRLVVLNACHSVPQAEAIGEHVDFVIGMDGEIDDEAAATFSKALYRAIAFGRTMREAFKLGIGELLWHHEAEHEIPQLLVRSGANAGHALIGSIQNRTASAPPGQAPTREARLADLLALLFTESGEFRRWVFYRLGGDVMNTLPRGPASMPELIFQTIVQAQQLGRIDAAFFRGLVTDHKPHTEKIRATTLAWLGNDAGIPVPNRQPRASTDEPSAPSPIAEPASDLPALDPGTTPTATAEPPTLWHIRLTLDRIRQWKELKDQCAESPGHLAFLVHGDAGQDVHLFVERVHMYLSKACKRIHRIYRVLFKDEFSTANTPGQWERRFRRATGFPDLPIAQALHRAAAGEPLMFILGNRTLRGLDDDETRALADTLAEHLPKWLADARPKHPIRVLVPIEHAEHSDDGMDDPLTRAVDDALERASENGIHFEPLIQLTMPDWHEVRDYVRKAAGPLGKEFEAACKRAYAAVARDPDIHERSFDCLAGQLNELLADRDSPKR